MRTTKGRTVCCMSGIQVWSGAAFFLFCCLTHSIAQPQFPSPKTDFALPAVPEIEVPELPNADASPIRRGPDPWTVVRPPKPQEYNQPPAPPPRVLTDWEKCSTRSADIEEVIRSCAVVIQDDEATPDQKVKALMIRAAINEGAGLSIPALADLNEVIKRAPRTPGAYERRGTIWLRERNYDQALKDFNAAIKLQPKSAELHVLRGMAYRSKSEPAEAMTDFDAAISLNPKYEVAYYERGRTRLEKKEYDLALKDFREALQVNPRFALAFYGIGSVYSEQNQIALAIAAFNEVRKLDPQMAALVEWQKGLARQRAGDCKSALEDYAAAMAAGLRNAAILKNRGICWRMLGKLDFAILELTQSIAVFSRDADAFIERGIAKTQKGDVNSALADFNEAIRQKPESAAAYLSRAQIRRAKKETKEALADLDKAISLQPSAPSYTERGITYFQLSDFGRALDDFDAALKLDQHFPMALFARGYLLRQSKDSRFSEFDMTEAVRRQPGILQRAKELGFGAE